MVFLILEGKLDGDAKVSRLVAQWYIRNEDVVDVQVKL